MSYSLIDKLRIGALVFFVVFVIIMIYTDNKKNNELKNAFIETESSFVIDSIQRLPRAVLIHLYELDSSFYEYGDPYLLLYNYAEHRDSVVKEKGVNGLSLYKFKMDYQWPILIPGYE